MLWNAQGGAGAPLADSGAFGGFGYARAASHDGQVIAGDGSSGPWRMAVTDAAPTFFGLSSAHGVTDCDDACDTLVGIRPGSGAILQEAVVLRLGTPAMGLGALSTDPTFNLSTAEAISGDGLTVVGGTTNDYMPPSGLFNGLDGFVRPLPDGVMTGLAALADTVPGDFGQDNNALGVSVDGGTIVGEGKIADGFGGFVSQPFRFTVGSATFEALITPCYPFGDARALDASAGGVSVVGQWECGSESTAFLFRGGGPVESIADLLASYGLDLTGWEFTSANAISDDGLRICGNGFLNGSERGWAAVVPPCDSIDFNRDGVFPDTTDIFACLTVFAGGACPAARCGDLDFNNDGVFPDTADLMLYLSVFSGGGC